MFVYLFLLFSALFMGFMFYLIKTAPYGYEAEDGFHFFKTLEDMNAFIASHKVSASSSTPENNPNLDESGVPPSSAFVNEAHHDA